MLAEMSLGLVLDIDKRRSFRKVQLSADLVGDFDLFDHRSPAA